MSQTFHIPQWVKSSNVYEINLRQYTRQGTFQSFEKELPRLREMGVGFCGLCPLTQLAGKNGWVLWAVIMR
jgi:1,4-alpha-glucan branching enzyme